MRPITEDEKFHLMLRRWIRLNLRQTTKLAVIRALVKDYHFAAQMEAAFEPLQNLWKQDMMDLTNNEPTPTEDHDDVA